MAIPDIEDDLKEIKKNIKQLQEGQGGGERPGFLRALKDYILDVKDTPQASVSKADEKESKGSALSEKDSKNLADLAKTNRIIAKALVESAREVRREKRRGVEPRIPSASTGATVTPAATATGGKQVAALLREPVTQQPQTEGAPDIPLPVPVTGTPSGGPKPPAGKPSLLGQGLQLGKDLLARAAPATPYALAAGALAAPFIAAGVSKRKIDEDPNAPGLEFQPYAMAVRGEAKTEGQAGRQNRDRAVGQMKWGEVKAFVESDMTDQELYEQLGRNRKELKEWLEQNKDGKTPYDKFTVAPAVASRAAESMIPWETPAVEPPPEVGAPPPITGMESAFVPTPPPSAPAPELEVGPTREMFEADQAQQARNVVMRRRKRPERADASARQQAEIEAGNLVEEDNAPQVEGNKPRKSLGLTEREKNEIQQMKERNRKLRKAAQSLGLDPNKVTGTFEGEKLTGIIDESGKEIDVSDRLSEEDKKSVNAERSMRAAMQGTQQSAPQVEPADKAQRPATATVMQSTETFDAAALAEKDPETHRKYVERLREIVREREKELENVPSIRQSVARSKIHSEARMQAQEEFFSQAAKVGAASRQTSIASVNERGDSAVVRESMGVQQTQQPTPQVEAAKPKEDETRPVSAAESFLMQQKGLDPNNEFDRKLYRRMDRTENRREQQRMRSQGYAPVDERGRVVGAELNTMSVQNNDLQRQGNSPSSQPIVIQNNSAPSTQTTVTPPAQPRVNSSFTRVMDIRNFWD
jgi:hypothetical protein